MFSADEELGFFLHPYEGSLHLAWRRLLSSPILDTKDRLGLKIFSAETSQHIEALRLDLDRGTYEPSPQMPLRSLKDDGAYRIKQFLSMRDRIVYQAIGNIIIENCTEDINQHANKTIFAHLPTNKRKDGTYSDFTFRRTFSNGVERGQYDKFLDTVYRDIKEASTREDAWLVQTDIASYYPSIDHQILRQLLIQNGWLKNERLLDLLMRGLSVWARVDPDHPTAQGVPIGYETSELLATLYLLDIGTDSSLGFLSHRRFVDDSYAIFESRRDAKRFVTEYDFLLQKRNLFKNAKKTKLRQCNGSEVEKAELDHDLRKELSYIKHVDTDDEENGTQDDLLSLFSREFPVPSNGSIEPGIVAEKIKILSFILYRLNIKNEYAKQLALFVLREFPGKSLHAAEYLRLFPEDPDVVNELIYHAQNSSEYPTLQVDCLKTLIKIFDCDNEFVLDALRNAILSHTDWYAREQGIDLYTDCIADYDLLSSVAGNDPSYLVRAKALFRAFEISNTKEQRVALINQAFADQDYTVQSLGVYLFRRDASITRNEVNDASLLEPLRQLLLSTEDIEDIQFFVDRFKQVFGFEVSRQLKFISRIADIASLNQTLVNMEDSDSDPIDFTQALFVFMIQFFGAVIRCDTPEFRDTDNSVGRLLSRYPEDSSQFKYLSELSLKKALADANDRNKIDYGFRRRFFKWTVDILAGELLEQYRDSQITIPSQLQEQLNKQEDRSMRDQIFVSYSHNDEVWLEEFRKHLKPYAKQYELDVWVDSRIKVGDRWKEEIKKALSAAKVAVLLITPDFISSDFIESDELPEILRAANEEGVIIVPIAVSDSTYEFSGIGDYQFANDPKCPLDRLDPPVRNSAWKKICGKIAEAAKRNTLESIE